MRISINTTNNYAYQKCQNPKTVGLNTANCFYTNSFIPYYIYGINFTSMKKNQFDGVDALVVAQFKAPIEKFKNKTDLQDWAEDKCREISSKEYGGRTDESVLQRKNIIKTWDEYITNENTAYSNTERLIILNGITKNLKSDEDTLPPTLNKGVLADTIYNLKNDLKSDKKMLFDFNKTSTNNLRAFYTEDISTGNDYSGWIVIPSKEHDSENFDSNVEKLKTLSHKTWCTKSNNAQPYLSEGDFHIYLEKGNPKIGVRCKGDQVAEIQGENNNGKIPVPYYDIVTSYFKEKDFNKYTQTAAEEIQKAKVKKAQANALRKRLNDAITNKDYVSIYETFGIISKKNKDGLLTLMEYKLPKAGNLLLTDIGLSESELFKNVSNVRGNVNLEDSELTSLYNLKRVGGDVNLNMSKLQDFGELESIGGNLMFNEIWDKPERAARVTSLKNIREIGGELDIIVSNIVDLGALQSVGVDCFLCKSKVRTLKNLEKVGGILDIQKTPVEDIGKLRTVGKQMYLNEALSNKDIDWGSIVQGIVYMSDGRYL